MTHETVGQVLLFCTDHVQYAWFWVQRFLGTRTSPTTEVEKDTPATDAWPSSTYQYFSWIGQYAPCFPVQGKRIMVLTEPMQFHEVLKVKARKAKHRITFASLYLGTGQLEQELVSCIHEACANAVKNNQTDFEVNILLDETRGSRGSVNSRTMLQGLLKDFPSHVSVSLYHTPDLRGFLKSIVPERFNETIGLTHLKVYLVDDSLIISGANLSNDYFTNRQDRYMLFNDCKHLADFFHDLTKTVASFSFQLQKDNSLQLHKSWDIHPFRGDMHQFKWTAKDKINALLDRQIQMQERKWRPSKSNTQVTEDPSNTAADCDTWVYPLVQMGPMGVINDEHVTLQLLRRPAKDDEILLASGYFNLTDHYMEVILQESLAKYKLLMASPEVNGFYGARGIAGYIPAAYIHIARQFFDQVQHYKQGQRIQLFEYYRNKWTFHVKGLWYYLPRQSTPSLTLIGSPNFGYRSVYRDLECQVAVVTDNEGLREQLREEHARIFRSSVPVTSERFQRADRRIPYWVTCVTGFIKHFF
ncbi:hypothetical protein BaRGS_00033359 [Batillaria attramentaria]|uniref:CDP-diacylglycerol--glycerol-3-phosphate 3-phosphatidyltransferase n=1 Tax=Batillaria attramentaria TaxID=370345 RepID=A0ABD0JKJ8_9CAEN